MLRPRWRKVLSDLWGNKVRSLLVIASISVGLFAVGLITNMHTIITEDMRAGYQAVNPANVQIFTSPFSSGLVDHIRKVPGVRQAEGIRTVTLRVRNKNGEWEPIEIRAIPDIEDMQISLLSLKEGVWPPGKHQIVVDVYKAGNLPVGVGGFVEIELPSSKRRKLELTGLTSDQTIGSTEAGGFFLSPVTGYITQETLEWLELPTTMNHLDITLNSDSGSGCCQEAYLREMSNRISKEIEKSGVVVISTVVRASDNHPNSVYVQAIASVLFLLGFLVVFLSGFLITNTLQALLNQQMHQIGIMKTIGGMQGQISSIYMVLIFLYGILAFLIAMPLSSQVTYILLEYIGSAINMQLQGYRIVPTAVLIQLVIALVVPQAAGFLPILHGTRISTLEALNGYSQANPPGKKGWVDHQLDKIRGISRPLLLSLRNTFRRKGRLALTLITLTLGGAIFIATFNSQRSLSNYIERIGRYFMADVNLTLPRNYRIREIEQILLEIPEVRAVEGWAASAGDLILADGSVGGTTSLLAPPAASKLVEPSLLEGRWVRPGDDHTLVVNERYREIYPDLKVGDTIRIKIAGEETDLVVVGFFQLAGRSGGYIAYTTYEYLSRQINEVNRANAFRITGTHPNMTLEEQKALGRVIEARLKERGIEIAEITAGHSLTATTADGLNILTAFLLIMASLIAIVGSIGLTGTMSLNVLERTREIGIMRAIGASDRALTNQVMVEGTLIGLMSWVLGTLLSFPISTIMSNAINLSLFGAAAAFTFTPTGVILWLVVVLVLSVLASVLPARSAARLTIREVLAYE